MRNQTLVVTALIAATAVWGAAAVLSAAQTGSGSYSPKLPLPPLLQPAATQAFVTTYCATCHNARLKTGGLTLDGLDTAKLYEHAEVWEKVVRKVRAGVMPPQGVRRPDELELQRFVASVEDG